MMKKALLKSMLGLLVLGMATNAHAASSYTLADNVSSTLSVPTLGAGDIATFSNTFGPATSFTDNWVFGLGPNLGLGGAVTNLDVSIGVTSILNISPFLVNLYAATSSGTPTGPLIESGTNFNLTSLSPGFYDLVVNGTAIGAGGGAYAGVVTATTVPLPAAAWLLLSGLAGVGAMARRRKSEQSA